jgi:hypothetical protein
MKDIFIDNTVAKNFVNPLDPEYKKLIAWLKTYNKNNHLGSAHLVVSKKIIGEYKRTCGASLSDNSIIAIVDLCTKQGRLNNITNDQIKGFRASYFTKKVCRHLRSNSADHDHIPAILLSYRKFAIIIDDAFIYDVVNFPGFHAIAVKRPEDINYK